MADVTIRVDETPIQVTLVGAQGPRGLPSGPLAENTVEAVHLSDDSGEQAAMLAKIGAADGSVFQKLDPAAMPVRVDDVGVGIDAFPLARLTIGPESPSSDTYVSIGKTVTGEQPAYGHDLCIAPRIEGASNPGGADYARCMVDLRPLVVNSTLDHLAGLQFDFTASGSTLMKDGWGINISGEVTETASVTKFRSLLVSDVVGAIGTLIGVEIGTLTASADVWAIHVDSETNDSKFGRVGICLNNASYAVHPSQGIDYNAPAGLPAAIAWRVDMSAYGFMGVARAAGDFGIATAVGDFIYRLQSKPFLLSTDGGISVNFRVDATTGNVTTTGSITAGGPVRPKGYTVATLPAAGTPGRMAYVTDATTPTFRGALTGGGAEITPVFDNGSAWLAG